MLNARQKGNRYELKMAHLFTDWWKEPEHEFRRTPLSGGWSSKHAAGDIFTSDKRFPFVVECRDRESDHSRSKKVWDFNALLYSGNKSVVGNWWVKFCEEKHPGKPILFVFTRKGDKDWIMFDPLEMHSYIAMPLSGALPTRLQVCLLGKVIWVVVLKDWFYVVVPEKIKEKNRAIAGATGVRFSEEVSGEGSPETS